MQTRYAGNQLPCTEVSFSHTVKHQGLIPGRSISQELLRLLTHHTHCVQVTFSFLVLFSLVLYMFSLLLFFQGLHKKGWIGFYIPLLRARSSGSQIGIPSPFCWGSHSSSGLRHQAMLSEAEVPAVTSNEVTGKHSAGDTNDYIFKRALRNINNPSRAS